MKNWPEIYNLIEIRKTPGSVQEFWQNQARYKKLTAEVAVDKASHQQLPQWEQSRMFATAVGLTADRAVVAGRAAARLWGLQVLSFNPTVELMYLDGKSATSKRYWPPQVIFRRCNLRSDEMVEHYGLRVTRIMRTLRDIAVYHGVLEALVSTDSARRKWPKLTKEYLREGILGGPRFKGVAAIREAIELSETKAESALESKGRYLILKFRHPEIRTIDLQAKIEGSSYQVDLLINGWLAIELDGDIKLDGTTFGKTDEVLRKERQREIFIQNTGRLLIRGGWDHLKPQADGKIPLLVRIEDAFRNHPIPTHL